MGDGVGVCAGIALPFAKLVLVPATTPAIKNAEQNPAKISFLNIQNLPGLVNKNSLTRR